MRSIHFLSFAFLSAFFLSTSVTRAGELSATLYAKELLQLPSFFRDTFENRRIEIESVDGASSNRKIGGDGLRVSLRDPSLTSARTRWEVANAVVHHWMKETLLAESHMHFLFRMSKVPADGEPHWQRLQKVAISALLGNLEKHDDVAARVWWKLKFAPTRTVPSGKLKKGEKVLLGIHQTGYPGPGGLSFGDVDFGHSVVALRTVGSDGETDLVANPGAKSAKTGDEVDLPPFPKEGVLSMIRVANLWNWAEFVLSVRGMELSYRIFRMSDEQREAIELLMRKGDRMHFGLALAWGNNCADGVYDIIQGLMTAGDRLKDRAQNAGALRNATKFTLPIWTLTEGQRILPFLSYLGDVRVHPKFIKDARGDYITDDYKPKSETKAYLRYRAFEDTLR